MPPSDSHFPDDSTDPVRLESDFCGDVPPSIEIVRAVAAIEDVDPVASPTALGMRLADQFDPEALDRLLTGADGGTSVTVELTLRNGHRYTVDLRAAGTFVVRRHAGDDPLDASSDRDSL